MCVKKLLHDKHDHPARKMTSHLQRCCLKTVEQFYSWFISSSNLNMLRVTHCMMSFFWIFQHPMVNYSLPHLPGHLSGTASWLWTRPLGGRGSPLSSYSSLTDPGQSRRKFSIEEEDTLYAGDSLSRLCAERTRNNLWSMKPGAWALLIVGRGREPPVLLCTEVDVSCSDSTLKGNFSLTLDFVWMPLRVLCISCHICLGISGGNKKKQQTSKPDIALWISKRCCSINLTPSSFENNTWYHGIQSGVQRKTEKWSISEFQRN